MQGSPQLAGQEFHCPHCSQVLVMPEISVPIFKPTVSRRTPQPQRSPGVAAVLSFFFPGVGQIYNGQIGKGLALFFLNMLTVPVALFFFVAVGGAVGAANQDNPAVGLAGIGFTFAVAAIFVFGYWFWNIYDAYSCAESLNRER
jgi:TM2 domain-containing membrane protein YozV